MQKLFLIDAADMKTVEKVQIFPQYRVDPYSFDTGMELAREISGLAKNKPFKVLNVSKLWILRIFYILHTIFTHFFPSKIRWFFHLWTLHGWTFS